MTPSLDLDVRADLHELIDRIQNPSFLHALRALLVTQQTEEPEMRPLSDAAKEAITEGIRQLDAGEGIPHEQVMAEMRQKYSFQR